MQPGEDLLKRALVAVDISDLSYSMIQFAFSFSRRQGIFHIDFIHVREEEMESSEGIGVHPPDPTAPERTGRYRIIEDMITNVLDSAPAEGITFNILVKTGDILEQILERGREMPYGFLIMGKSRKKDLDTLFEGSLQNAMIMNSPCPLLIFVPRKEKWFIR